MTVSSASTPTLAELWKNSAPEEVHTAPSAQRIESLAWRTLYNLGQLALHSTAFEMSGWTWFALSSHVHPAGAVILALVPHFSASRYLLSGKQTEGALLAKISVAELFYIIKLFGLLLRAPLPTPLAILSKGMLSFDRQISLSAIEITLPLIAGMDYAGLFSFQEDDEPHTFWKTHTKRTLCCLTRLGERDNEWPPFLERVRREDRTCEATARAIAFAFALYYHSLPPSAKSSRGRQLLHQCTTLTTKLRKMSGGKFTKTLCQLRDDQKKSGLLKKIRRLSDTILSDRPSYNEGIAAWKNLHRPPRPSACQRITEVLQKALRDLGNFLYDLNRQWSYPL